jgi:hypothetical protein
MAGMTLLSQQSQSYPRRRKSKDFFDFIAVESWVFYADFVPQRMKMNT